MNGDEELPDTGTGGQGSAGEGLGDRAPEQESGGRFRQLGGEDVVDPGATDTDIGGTVGTDGWPPPGVLRNHEDETPSLE